MVVSIEEINTELIKNLECAQEELYACLNDENNSNYKGLFKIKKKFGDTDSGKGHYIWIDVESKNYPENKFTLGLCREHLDVNSGNIHHDFTKLQMSRNPFLHKEKGGDVNPRPISAYRNKDIIRKLYAEDNETLNKILPSLSGGRISVYITTNCFPRPDKTGIESGKNPWGYAKLEFASEGEIIEMSSEIMDRKNPKYDAKKVASFFLQLCAHDIEECEKAKKSK